MRMLSVTAVLASLIFLTVPAAASGQADSISVTIIYDNYAHVEGMETDWGFAALIETGDQAVLFDAGANGDLFLRNFRALGKDPEDVDVLVFSHGHGDHTGGMEALFETGVRPPTFLLGAFNEQLRDLVAGTTRTIEAEPGDEVLAGMFTTGQVGEAIPEQALVIPTARGLVVITGCAHAGVVAMLERVRELSDQPVHLVFGGFHLSGAPAQNVAATVRRVRSMGVERVGATHCTGDAAIAAFAAEYGEDFVNLGVGRALKFAAER